MTPNIELVAEPASILSEECFAFPLTPAQEKMWDEFCKHPEASLLNGAFRMNLSGRVDPVLLERTLREIVQRHEILRATFGRIDGEVRQIISPTIDFSLDIHDLRSMPEDVRAAESDRICRDEAQLGFNLNRDPLIRAKLIQLEDVQHILTITVHQIISDGYSIGLVMEEMQQIYAAFAEGRPSPLPDLTVQYGDYVIWQQERMQRLDTLAQLGFWKRKLSGYRPLQLEPDASLSGSSSSDAAIVSMLLPSELIAGLKALGNEHNATFFVTTLTAYMALLHYCTGKQDLTIGTPFAGRNFTELERLVGQFVNHALIRINAEGDPTLAELLLRVRETVWEALANQAFPFERILSSLRDVPPDTANSPFALNFICQREYGRADAFNFDFAGVRMSTMPSISQGALYDVNLFLVEREAGWRLSVEYKTGLYQRETALGLLHGYLEVLKWMVAGSNQRLSQLTLADVSLNKRHQERHIPTSSRTDSADSLSANGGVFLRGTNVSQIPASLTQRRFWLVSQLSSSGNHLPVRFKITGNVSVDALEKSLQFLVARHEILRTSFEERGNQLVQIISRSSEFHLPQTDVEAFADAEREEKLDSLMRDEAERPFELNDGQLFRTRLFRVDSQTHILSLTLDHILADGWSMGVLTQELWTSYEAIVDGARVPLPVVGATYSDFAVWQNQWLESKDAEEHLSYWRDTLGGQLPILNFPTDRLPTRKISSRAGIETVLIPDDLTSAVKALAQANQTTTFVFLLTCFSVMLYRSTDQEDVIIGSPFANRSDETETILGPLAGPVALRYDLSGNPDFRTMLLRVRDVTLRSLGHAALPFEVVLEQLAVRSVGGRSPFFQFYFSYQRAFVQQKQVRDLVVGPMSSLASGIPFEMHLSIIERAEGLRAELQYNTDLFDSSTGKSILEYYVALLKALTAKPEQLLSDLPLPVKRASHSLLGLHELSASSDNARFGKDMSAADSTDREGSGSFVGPRDAIEVALKNIWEQLLEARPIGVTATFFSLGGHSLMLLKLLKMINKEFDINLEITRLFQAPTIEQLANIIRELSDYEEWSSLVPINIQGSKKPFFLVHSYMLYGRLPGALGGDQPFYGLKQPPLGIYVTPDWVDDMVEDHIKQIRLVQSEGPYQIAGWCFAGLMAYEIARRLEEGGSEVSMLALLDSWCPYHPVGSSNGPSESGTGKSKSRLHSILRTFNFHLQRFFNTEVGHKTEVMRKFIQNTSVQFAIRFTRHSKAIAYRAFSKYRIPKPAILRDVTIVTYEWLRHYHLRRYKGDILLIRPQEVPVSPDADSTCGWGRMTTGDVRSVFVPGNRRSMFLEPNLSALAERLGEFLSK